MASTVIEELAAGGAPGVAPLTVEQYHAMIRNGILHDGDPIELIEGVLLRKDRSAQGGDPMSHGDHHALAVECLQRFFAALPAELRVRSQLPVALSATSEPEPDVVVARAAGGRHPCPEEILLAVEVSDSSLAYDRRTKLRLYASAGVPVYWIVNIPERQVEVYEEPVPTEGRYARRTDLKPGATLRVSLAGAGVELAVDRVLPPVT